MTITVIYTALLEDYIVMYDNWQRGKIRKEYITIKDMDFHVMNKGNFMELIA